MIEGKSRNNDALPMISVIMPVYNAEKYLDEAIKSILCQTYQDFEFIIINDGSTDKSLEVIKKYEDMHDSIILISRENKGIITSLNEGISLAKGKYIARMDSDDISLPERLYKQFKTMEEYNLDICGGHYFLIKEDSSFNGLNLTPRTHDLCVLSLASMVPFAHPSVMIRSAFLKLNNLKYGQSEFITAEDLDMWMRMYELGAKFGNVDDLIFKYRVVANSLSKIKRNKLKKETKQLLKRYLRKHKNFLIKIIENTPNFLNDHERSLIVRFCYKYFFSYFDFRVLKFLSLIEKKIIIMTIISEIKNA